MKYFDWNKEKNDQLKKERNISFEQVVITFEEGKVLDIIKNPSSNFPNQKAFVIKINDYIYYVPFVEEKDTIFLKTIIPSRKARKKYTKII